MIGSMATLVVKGVMDVGITNFWERNLDSGRLEFFKWVKNLHMHLENF